MDCTDLTQNTERMRAVVNAVKNLRVPSNRRNFLTGNLLASQDGPLSMELDSYGVQ